MAQIRDFKGKKLTDELLRRVENPRASQSLNSNGNKYLQMIYYLLDYIQEKGEASNFDISENVLSSNRSEKNKTLQMLVDTGVLTSREGGTIRKESCGTVRVKFYKISEEGRDFVQQYLEKARDKIQE